MENGNMHDCALHCEKKVELCVIGNSLKQNTEFIKALKHFSLPVTYIEDINELKKQSGENNLIYILEEFEGEVFECLQKSGERLLGPTIVIQCANRKEDLPNKNRPLYSTSMKNLVLSFTGFRQANYKEMKQTYSLARYMSAGLRKDLSVTKTTHLVATTQSIFSEKYKFAAATGIPIMTKEWIYKSWDQRHDVNSNVMDKELMQYKLLPFVRCKLAFVGYQTEEQQHMTEIAIKNGGEAVRPKDRSCTHVIVEDGTYILSSEYSRSANILKNEWFWASLQIEARVDEQMYKYENPNTALMSSSVMMPETGNKRERLESVAHQLALESQEYHTVPDFCKRESKGSSSDSVLDVTVLPISSDIQSSDDVDGTLLKSPPLNVHSLSKRQQICLELFQTESNYVGILNTIITVFKEPLEKPNQVRGPLLAPAEINIIFGTLPPIYDVHLKMLEELSEIVQTLKEHGVGNIILKHAYEFMKSYPPFVNFFEKSKEVLAVCNATKPRFHAFLKCCQSKPECGRQTLQELLIRPVQRLPSIILLLNDFSDCWKNS